MNVIRTRWAAIGAAVAVTLGAGGMAGVQATIGSGERTVFVPITPCRIFDTRPDSQVGPRSAPLGPNHTHPVMGRGAVGDCNISTDAAGLGLNVTAVGATQDTFLTIYPTDAPERPEASSLNPSAGEPPTPNAVTTDLSAAGELSIYNAYGSVHVLADVVGYYQDHNHDDRYYTQTEIDNRSGRVVATGFYSGTVQELDTADGVAVTSQAGALGVVTLTVTGVDTADVPVFHVTPLSGAARICNAENLATLSATSFLARFHCYELDGDSVAAQFAFSIID